MDQIYSYNSGPELEKKPNRTLYTVKKFLIITMQNLIDGQYNHHSPFVILMHCDQNGFMYDAVI